MVQCPVQLSKLLHLLALRIPKPPLNLLFVIWCQPTRCTLPFSSVEPQRKFQFILSNSSQTFWGRRAVCIVYIGRANVVDWISVSLPAIFNNLAFQPDLALSLRNLHKFSEKPFHELVARQDTSPSSLWQASLQWTWFNTSREVFGDTNTWDLLRLTLWPEMLQNSNNVWRITDAWESL